MLYRPEIDGLRAFAVLPVVFYHAGFAAVPGGYVGVDVFFVVSGYLITSIIAGDLRRGRFSIAHFYERRARRILPALIFVIAVFLPIAWVVLLPGPMREVARSAASAALFSSNILFWLKSGYFDTAAELKPLLHTWSLAVEEQFYILFPPLLMACWRFGLARVAGILGGLFAASLAVAVWSAANAPMAGFFLLPARVYELMIGAFCALWLLDRPVPRSGAAATVLPLAGLAAIGFAVVTFDGQTAFPGAAALLPTLGTALVILFAGSGTPTAAILSLRPVVGLGLVSYSLYLWHQPVFAFWRQWNIDNVTPVDLLPFIALSLALAVFSYYVVEQPFRRRDRLDRATVFGLSGAALAAVFGLGLAGYLTGGAPGRAIPAQFDVRIARYEIDNERLRSESWSMVQDRVRALGRTADDANGALWFDPEDDRIRVLLVGNSHSKDLYNMLSFSKTAAERLALARYDTQIAEIGSAFFRSPNYREADVVMLASRLSDADLPHLGEVARAIARDGKTLVLLRNIHEFPSFRARTLNLADYTVLTSAADGDLEPAAIARLSDRRYYAEVETPRGQERNQARNDRVEQVAADLGGVPVLDRMPLICPDTQRRCLSMSDELEKYFYDEGHLTLAGARRLAEEIDRTGWLDPVLMAASRDRAAARTREEAALGPD